MLLTLVGVVWTSSLACMKWKALDGGEIAATPDRESQSPHITSPLMKAHNSRWYGGTGLGWQHWVGDG